MLVNFNILSKYHLFSTNLSIKQYLGTYLDSAVHSTKNSKYLGMIQSFTHLLPIFLLINVEEKYKKKYYNPFYNSQQSHHRFSNHSIKVTLFRLYCFLVLQLCWKKKKRERSACSKKIVDKKRSNLLFTDVLVLRWRYGL